MTNHSNQDKNLDSYLQKQSKFLTPFQRKLLLKNLEADLQPEHQRRLEIMLLADQGKSQTQICQDIKMFSGNGAVLERSCTSGSGT